MQEYSLYNGSVLLRFDEKKHAYLYEGNIIPGVTSVTDICFDKSGPISGWALNQGVEYLRQNWPIDGYVPLNSDVFNSLMDGMKKAHHRKKKDAANVGTMAHEWIEQYIAASIMFAEIPALPTEPRVLYAVNNFLDWEKQNHVVYLFSERKVFSVEDLYAGTLDILAIVNGIRVVLDLKTSNAYRNEYALQTAAYLKAVNEEDGTNDDTRIILMLPKDGDSEMIVKTRGPETFAGDFRAFKNSLENYRWLKSQ